MGQSKQENGRRNVLNLAGGLACAALLAGCSSDVSRLAEGPFGVDRTPTASISARNPLSPPEAVGGAGYSAPGQLAGQQSAGLGPSSSISSAPLAPLGAVQSAPLASPSVAAAPAPVRAPANSGPWTAAGGTAITVAASDNAASLASRYGVPQGALLRVNGLASPAQVRPGARLIIPVYNAASGAASAAGERPMAQPAPQTVAARSTYGQPGQIQQAGQVQHPAQVAPKSPDDRAALAASAGRKAEDVAKKTAVQTPAQPAAAAAAAAASAAPGGFGAKPAPLKPAPAVATAGQPVKTAKVEESAKPGAKPAPKAADPETTASTPAADAKPEFRWPARGRIIQGFKAGSNEGIKIAVPEGTAVKAAEAGVVAYAGSELKDHGNLVLIRHPNGFVSAYAHNGEVSVRRGDSVKRGQVIAKSGQSGNVSSPQLHFELRKGSTPVDPTGYLAGL